MSKPITYVQCGKNDVLGDSWARRVGELYKQALERRGIPEIGDGMGAVWQLFQYQYCNLAGMESRIIASPHAMIAAGWPIEDRHVEMAYDLLYAQSEILEEQRTAAAAV